MSRDTAEARRRELLNDNAQEVALCFDNARQRLDFPVILLLDTQDSLARAICEHYGKKALEPVVLLALSRAEALPWLEGGPASERVGAKIMQSDSDVLNVIVIAEEGATFESLPL